MIKSKILIFLFLLIPVTSIVSSNNIHSSFTKVDYIESIDENTGTIDDLIEQYRDTITAKPTDLEIYELATLAGARYPEVVVAQAIIESNCGNSVLARSANNLFGMGKLSKTSKRRTTQHPTKHCGRYGVYDNWQLSVLDLVLWEQHVIHSASGRADYCQRVARVYAPGNTTYAGSVNATARNWLRRNNLS